ncbi:MAG TPA: cytochrome b/b6 domain-containing protein [Rhodoferax sp.]
MPRTSYDTFSRLTHWLTAVVILVAMVVGFFFSRMPDSGTFQFFSTLNKSLGTLLLPVMISRYVWRHFRPEVAYPPNMAAWNRGLAHLFHEVFYLVILTAVVSGLGMLKTGFYLCWLLYIPPPVKDLEMNYLFASIHTIALNVLGVMLLLHIAAVVWHYKRGRQAILYRMRPTTAKTTPLRL